MKVLRLVDDVLGRAEGAVLVGLLSVMIILSFVQVVLRNVFSESLLWGEILLRHLVLWIGFFGAARATGQGRHINIDALTRFLTPRLRIASRILTNTFALGVCYFLLQASVTFIGDEIEFGNTLYGDVPTWYSQIIIPVGFGLMMFHFLVRVLRGVQDFRTGSTEE